MKKIKYNWLPSFVYGGIDGAITTFAVVMGVVGANLSTPIILVLGFANLFADGLSMALGKFSSDKAEVEQIKHIKEQERISIIQKPKEEKEEIRVILKKLGFKGKNLEKAQEVITSDPEIWVHMMLHHEFHIMEDNINPIKGALSTLSAFILIGLIPLLAFIVQPIFDLSEKDTLIFAISGTLLALFIVGMVKSKFTKRFWLVSGLETAGIGALGAGVAYLVGYLLQGLI